MPELIQGEARAELIGAQVLERLDEDKSREMQIEFEGLHHELKRGASEQAADAIAALLERSSKTKS